MENIRRANSFLALRFPMIITKPWRAGNKNVFGPPKFGTKIWTTERCFTLDHSSSSKCWELKVWPEAKKLSTSNSSSKLWRIKNMNAFMPPKLGAELWNAKNFHRFAIELWRLESKKTIGPT